MENDLDQRAQQVVSDLYELADFTSDENGAQRIGWTPLWREARAWFREKAESLGAEVTRDAAGNVWTKLAGQSEEAIAVGSHLDCVPNGGWLDGCLGVLSALEALRFYAKSGTRPKKTLYVVDWADEEAARFGSSCQGSSAVSGHLDIAGLLGRKDPNGVLFEDALEENGIDPAHMLDTKAQLAEKNLRAYLEFHIEQGPVLEQEGQAVACVYGAAGVERHAIEFSGQAAHAGSFPTKMRHDAFLAAAQAALDFRKIALKYNAVCTVGQASVEPDVVTIVPGKCRLALDQRTIDPEDLQHMYQEAKLVATLAAAAEGVKVDWQKIYSVEPQLFDDHLIDLCKEAVKEETGIPKTMYSGPLHDAVEMAKVVPTVMMFVMSENGLSHTKEENTPEPELKTGIRAFLRLIDKVINE